MKKQLIISPVGLKGNEILERQKQLMGISSINEDKKNYAVELTKVGPDGNAYAVIRENHEWYIKKANKVKNLIAEDFKYIGGLQNKKQESYPSYAKAIKHLNLKFKSLAEAYNFDGEINVFENDNLLSETPMAAGFAEMKSNGFSGHGNLEEDMSMMEYDNQPNTDPTKEEMVNYLKDEFGGFEGNDDFSSEEAIYWYAYNNHGGQRSNLYSVLSTSEYKPSPLYSNIDDSDDEISLAMYNTLAEKFGGEEIGQDYDNDEVELTEYEQAIDAMIDDNSDDDGLIGYEVPEWAMSSLINGDDSGLSEEDIEKLNSFVKDVSNEHGNASFMLGDIEGEDDLGFRHSNDIDSLGSNVYRIYIKPSKNIDERKKSFPDLTGDGKVTRADILKGRGVDLKESVKKKV